LECGDLSPLSRVRQSGDKSPHSKTALDRARIMDPVRIKLYGLFPTTRRGYVRQLVVAGVLCLGLLTFRLSLPPSAVHEDLLRNQPALVLIVRFWTYIPWVVLGLFALIALEAFFVFRKFARAEALQNAAAAPSGPSNPNPG
jgi:hypothetical protein